MAGVDVFDILEHRLGSEPADEYLVGLVGRLGPLGWHDLAG